MKIKILTIATAILAAHGFTAIRCAAQSVPNLINYQGRLTDQTGAALPQGQYQIQFRLWDSPTATNTSDLIWGQQQTLTIQSNGMFATIFGSGGIAIPGAATNDLSFAFVQSNRYFGLTVVTSNGVSIAGASEILPRQQVLSTPYALQAGFAATAQTVLTAPIPHAVVVMWSGTLTNVPTGWVLCDGSNGTPDLRDRFVVGASQNDQGVAKSNVSGSLTQTGGEASHTLTIAEMPAHTHSVQVFPDPISGGNGSDLSRGVYTGQTGSTGGGQPHNILHPYFALAFIMNQ
jgi:microcystin-dependent protein